MQGLPKCRYNTINRLCPLKSIIIKHMKKHVLHLYLISLCKISCSAPQGPHQRQSLPGGFDHWWFPCTCCLTGLNCYNVTCGSGTCNNVTSSSAKQVCRHGFTNMVSNVMTKGYFLSHNYYFFHVQNKFNMAHIIFQWLPLIFKDFSRQNAIFPGQHKIPWLFQSRVKFHDFSRPVEPWIGVHWSSKLIG